ncbi:MAG: sn-glycerol-3-phosphate ABC transporter ATP-binding protein UgpC [Bacteroidia bacterium]|nr:sn-glycerol-3-phosphate ABC transporter ATP-binding protein UgpC [Bacteroidia bacterium]
MAQVQLNNIEKVYEGGFKAAKDINLQIRDKEFVVFVGPSGCGKSTLLRMIAGLEEITKGELIIGDDNVTTTPAKNRGIAMVFQNYALYPHMTVFENMAFGLKIKKVNKKEIEERVMAAAKILELEDLMDKRPGQMSGGQRQRVAIGRAIVRRPKVFLFDEPLSNLDAKLRGQMRVEIAKLHKKLDATMIYVTHDQVEAMTLGDRIAVLNEGKLEQFDTPMNLYNQPKNIFVARFIGSPPMNLIEGRIIEKDKTLRFKDVSGQLEFDISSATNKSLSDSANQSIVMGIRSENVTDKAQDNGMAFQGEITSIELLGNEQIITVSGLSDAVICRVSTKKTYELGDTAKLYMDLSSIYFFEKETEQRINLSSEI